MNIQSMSSPKAIFLSAIAGVILYLILMSEHAFGGAMLFAAALMIFLVVYELRKKRRMEK